MRVQRNLAPLLPAVGRTFAPLRRGLCAPALPAGVLTTHYKKISRANDPRWEGIDMDRFADETDLLIVGGGPAGLAAAIKFKQLCNEEGLDYRVTLLEKAPLVGGHTCAIQLSNEAIASGPACPNVLCSILGGTG